MTDTNNAHKKAIRKYQGKHPGTTFPEARRATDRNEAPRVRLGKAGGKTVWLDLTGSVVTPVVGRTGSGKTTILRLIAAELAASRSDIDVRYIRRGPSRMRVPVPSVETPNIFEYLWEVMHARLADEPDRLLVLVVDELNRGELESVADIVQALRGLRMHLVIGTQSAASSLSQWTCNTSDSKPWRQILGYARQWIYMELGIDRKCYLGFPRWLHGDNELIEFTPNDEAAHIAARAVVAGSPIEASFAAVGIGLPALGKAPDNPVAVHATSVGDVAVLRNGYGVVLGSGSVYVDGRLLRPEELAVRPDFLGFTRSAVRSAALDAADGVGERAAKLPEA